MYVNECISCPKNTFFQNYVCQRHSKPYSIYSKERSMFFLVKKAYSKNPLILKVLFGDFLLY